MYVHECVYMRIFVCVACNSVNVNVHECCVNMCPYMFLTVSEGILYLYVFSVLYEYKLVYLLFLSRMPLYAFVYFLVFHELTFCTECFLTNTTFKSFCPYPAHVLGMKSYLIRHFLGLAKLTGPMCNVKPLSP